MEATILLWIQENLRADWLTPIVKGITYLGEAGWFWIALTVLLLCLPKYRKIGVLDFSYTTDALENQKNDKEDNWIVKEEMMIPTNYAKVIGKAIVELGKNYPDE